MSDTMMALGEFRFGIATAAYESLLRTVQYRWPIQERINRPVARQFVGIGEETCSLEGVIYPHHAGGLSQLQSMRDQAGKGEPLMMVTGLGDILGRWVILRVEEGQTVFFSNGMPRKVTFKMELARYGEDNDV